MPAVVITREEPLRVETWEFICHDHTLYLDSYKCERRKTARHKFRIASRYDSSDRRGYVNSIEAPHLPLEIAAEALEKFRDSIFIGI